MKKTAAFAGLAAVTLLDISASTPVVAQGANPFAGGYFGIHTGSFSSDPLFSSSSYQILTPGLGTAPARADRFNITGGLTGVHGGFNFPVGGNFILGIEGDVSNLDESDSVSFNSGVIGADGLSFQYRSELEFDWQSTLRTRFGFVAGNILFFGTAGIAFLNAEWTETGSKSLNFGTPTTFYHAKDETLVGGVIGGGAEFAFTPNIVFGTDYLYENFEDFNPVPHGVEAGQTGRISDINVHKVRVRLSIKFGGPPQ